MKSKDSCESAVTLEKSTNNTHLHMIVDGCKVKLNFPPKSGDSAVNDVKRMMLGGVTKP